MLTDNIQAHSKQNYELIDDLRGEKIIWAKDTTNFPQIALSLGIKGVPVEAENERPQVAVLDLGKLLLQYAKDGELGKVHELIARGAPFTTDWLGMSALHFAAMNNRYEICEILLRGGVNKDVKTKVDRTPLHFAVYEGHENIVKLLISKNCDINPTDMLRMTPLHWAVEKGHKSIARLLIKYGANVTAVSKFNKTPISLAIQTKQTDLLTELEAEKHKKEETETNEAVKSIAETSNYDSIMTSLSEELHCMEKISYAPDKTPQKSQVPIEEELFTNKTDTCQSSDDLIDEDMDYVEPIIQLESIEDEQKQMDTSTLELLKYHGISMLPLDDPENNLITSALQSGRKLVLSEAGKRILNDTKMKQMSENVADQQNEIIPEVGKLMKKNPVILRAKGLPLKANKNIKIISMDTFKKIYGTDMVNNIRKVQGNLRPQDVNATPTITKITKIHNGSSINGLRTPTTKVQPTSKIISVQKVSRKPIEEDDLPPNIEVCTDSEPEEITPIMNTPKSTSIGNINTPIRNVLSFSSTNRNFLSNSKNPPLQSTSEIFTKSPVISLPEVSRQLFLLKKQMDELRTQFELVQKQNAEYKARIEQLERRDRERNGIL